MRTSVIPLYLCLSLSTWHAASATHAQQSAPELPQPSPKARIEQRVGLTDLSVDYSSPAVRERVIWGGVVAYDKPWRTGANAATTLRASRDFVFAGKPVTAGTYALYTVPGKNTWAVALSSKTDAWGNDGYDTKYDIARVNIKPSEVPNRERLTFLFDNTTDNGTQLTLQWEKLQVAIPITVDTKKQVDVSMQKALDDAWRPHFASARYLLDNGGDLDLAMRYIDQSIAIKATWWNNWVRAQLLQKKGRPQEAVASAEQALKLGHGDRTFDTFFKGDVSKSVAEWKK